MISDTKKYKPLTRLENKSNRPVNVGDDEEVSVTKPVKNLTIYSWYIRVLACRTREIMTSLLVMYLTSTLESVDFLIQFPKKQL